MSSDLPVFPRQTITFSRVKSTDISLAQLPLSGVLSTDPEFDPMVLLMNGEQRERVLFRLLRFRNDLPKTTLYVTLWKVCLSGGWLRMIGERVLGSVMIDVLGSSNMGAWGWGHLGCYSLLLDFVHLHVSLGILHLYGRTTLLHRFAFWTRVFAILSGPSLCIPSQHKNTEFTLSFCIFELFITQKSSIAFGRGESE